jgi:hypothetical protein
VDVSTILSKLQTTFNIKEYPGFNKNQSPELSYYIDGSGDYYV